jgi:hypothetical protein
MKSKAQANWLTGGLWLAGFVAWALFAARLIWNQGDHMLGFHPVMLASFPGAFIGAASAIFLLISRQWQIGSALGLGALILFLVVWNARAIEEHAWRSTIISNSQDNEKALASIQTDIKDDVLFPLWESEKLSPMEGFRWFGTNHVSAPKGVYYGFRIDGIPHVRIQKIRRGWRGIALAHSESVLTILAARTKMKYSRVGSSDWYTWSTE